MKDKLSDFAFNRFSQFGEDGIVEKILERIEVEVGTCIEFGASDGFRFSNTANLWTNGWNAVLIECDPILFASLAVNTQLHSCRCINARVTSEGEYSLESILRRERISDPVDLLSIDIDGDDYHIFASLGKVKPKLIVCEYNPTIPVDYELVQEPGGYFGCSAKSLVSLAESKGYALVAMTDTNCFFVLEQYIERFVAYETSLDSLMPKKHLTYLVTGYAGDYYALGKPPFGCRKPSNQEVVGEVFSLPIEIHDGQNTLKMQFRNLVGRVRSRLQQFDLKER